MARAKKNRELEAVVCVIWQDNGRGLIESFFPLLSYGLVWMAVERTGKAHTGILFGIENIQQTDEKARLLLNLVRNTTKSVQSKPNLVNRRGLCRHSRAEMIAGSGGGENRGDYFLPPSCRVKFKTQVLFISREVHSSTYLLQLQLGTTSVISIGSQAGGQKPPDGVGIHGGRRVWCLEGLEQGVGRQKKSRERVGVGS
jgi:hypothetical protein